MQTASVSYQALSFQLGLAVEALGAPEGREESEVQVSFPWLCACVPVVLAIFLS